MTTRVLVLYDDTGYVISTMSGSVREPVGIKFIWVDVPVGCRVLSVNITDPNDHKAVLSDPPRDIIAEKLAELSEKQDSNDMFNLMVLEAMADLYETVLPFLPPM